jgi:nicotinamidase-related amidase
METKTALLLIDIQNDYREGDSNPLQEKLYNV